MKCTKQTDRALIGAAVVAEEPLWKKKQKKNGIKGTRKWKSTTGRLEIALRRQHHFVVESETRENKKKWGGGCRSGISRRDRQSDHVADVINWSHMDSASPEGEVKVVDGHVASMLIGPPTPARPECR